MRYYKMTDPDGKLTAIGTGDGGTEIIEKEYAALFAEIEEKAALVASLAAGEITEADIREAWREEIIRRAEAEEMQLQTIVYTLEMLTKMTNADLEIILAGMGVSARMNKANMIRLILSLQGSDYNELV